ncbi:restriction endonuclease [Promicromonospora sp. MEB111]|uniref:restriction endonuclease n=1 Tax=Promicromonospora sp. MEB111 TaxID=3040301 RepID=UPI00254F9470|nr:restriction endonuclease [Promicromonospora sp. MEB111]
MSESVFFADLHMADLVLDRVYQGGSKGNMGDDPIGKLLPVGNQGGFRYKGSVDKQDVRLVVLYTSGEETDWPDQLDPTTGDFTYYGDNRKPGSGLHETQRKGNLLLRDIFDWSRGDATDREAVPPLLLFQKSSGRDVVFRGLLAPGSPRLESDEELVAVWRTTRDRRFQNYRAHFTMLDTPAVTRSWIDQILARDPLGDACPPEWRAWVKSRSYRALEAPRTIAIRTKEEQLPLAGDLWILETIYRHFSHDPIQFEHFAASVWARSDNNVEAVEVTRPSRDGGRDALGTYRLGPATDPVRLEFALEAKCYGLDTGVGVKMVSRLISRLKHREFGVFVTTSFISQQAYSEIREDQHPVVFITGRDIVESMKRRSLTRPEALEAFLSAEYPIERSVVEATLQDGLTAGVPAPKA